MTEKQTGAGGIEQTKHPLKLKAMLYRVRDPELVADSLIRAAAESWHLISRSESSKLYRRFLRTYDVQRGTPAWAA